MRFAVEAWAPEYGAPLDEAVDGATTEPVVLDVEVAPEQWAPRRPPASTVLPASVLFTDGVRRIDARVWIADGEGVDQRGICASYAAGAVLSNGSAKVVAAKTMRAVLSPAASDGISTVHGDWRPERVSSSDDEDLSVALQKCMGKLEAAVVRDAGGAGLVVVDGPISGMRDVPEAVGYVKTHRVQYLQPPQSAVVAALEAGERTPLFVTGTRFGRYSWYLRLPGPVVHSWAGVVRCELAAGVEVAEAVRVADVTAAVLPRFASKPHKDTRAPQNLYPIAGLERQLRHRLGDPTLLHRSLLRAAATTIGG